MKETKQDKINLIHNFVNQYGRLPRYHEYKVTPGFPSGGYFLSHFKTFNEAIEEAGYATTTITDTTTKRQLPKQDVFVCNQCNKVFELTGTKRSVKHRDSKKQKSKGKHGNIFCSRSCSTSYTNCHKDFGTRRSKLEAFIELQLPLDFPNIEFIFNSKQIINSELDIYIPALKMAIELNGIVHYEPIYGVDKFIKIQNNDKQKIIRCYEKDVELAIIDVSKCSTIKQHRKYYDIVKNIIIQNLQRAQ